MPEESTKSIFRVFSSALVWRFLVFQTILVLIPFSTFVLLILGQIDLPANGFSFTNSNDIRPLVGGILITASLFSFSSLFCCLGLFVSHAGREEFAQTFDKQRFLSHQNYSLVASINFLGLIFGVLTVFIFLGGFISGSLFPNFQAGTGGVTDFKSVVSSLAHLSVWAKLAVWAFLFGFSERLLPNLLNNFARQIEKDPIHASEKSKDKTVKSSDSP